MQTKSFYKTIKELETDTDSPIPYAILEHLDVDKIEGVSWQTEDNALVNITIIFEKEDNEEIEFISEYNTYR
jgi:hypothetical protein